MVPQRYPPGRMAYDGPHIQPMDYVSAIATEAARDYTGWILLLLLSVTVLVRLTSTVDRSLLRAPWLLMALHLLLVPATGLLRQLQAPTREEVHLAAVALGLLTAINALT